METPSGQHPIQRDGTRGSDILRQALAFVCEAKGVPLLLLLLCMHIRTFAFHRAVSRRSTHHVHMALGFPHAALSQNHRVRLCPRYLEQLCKYCCRTCRTCFRGGVSPILSNASRLKAFAVFTARLQHACAVSTTAVETLRLPQHSRVCCHGDQPPPNPPKPNPTTSHGVCVHMR